MKDNKPENRRGRQKIEFERLEGEITSFKKRLAAKKTDDPSAGQENKWIVGVEGLLEEARNSLKDNKNDLGWRLLHAAKQLYIFTLDQGECKTIAIKLREESGKLNAWRKNTVLRLVDEVAQEGKQEASQVKFKTYLASLIKDEHYENQYHKIHLRAISFKYVRGGLLIVLSLIIAFSVIYSLYGKSDEFISQWPAILAVALFGALGAIFSSAITLTRNVNDNKDIPDVTLDHWVTFTRPFIGAGAGIAAYILLNAGLLNTAAIDPCQGSSISAVVLAFAFISGFSERLIIQAAE